MQDERNKAAEAATPNDPSRRRFLNGVDVPGSAFTDGDTWDAYMRLCIARGDDVLDGALAKLQTALSGGLRD